MIVQNDRVAAAACFLPLTINPRLSKELGSRHRAAIGLTEENDAVAIVVSEESGIISVVVDGQIERGFDADTLRTRLRSAHAASAHARRRVGKQDAADMRRLWPFRNFGLKLLSVAIGVLLWISVSGEEIVERGLRAPLELQQFPVGLEIQGEAPSTVDVRVRGTSGALSRVAAGDIVAVLDLHAVRGGQSPLRDDAGAGAFAVRRRSGAGDAVHDRARARKFADARSAGGAVRRGRRPRRVTSSWASRSSRRTRSKSSDRKPP